MKVNIKLKKYDLIRIKLFWLIIGDSAVKEFLHFCSFQNFIEFVKETSHFLVSQVY